MSLCDLFWGEAQEMGQRFAEIFVGESSDLEDEQHQDAEKCLDPMIVEMKPGDIQASGFA